MHAAAKVHSLAPLTTTTEPTVTYNTENRQITATVIATPAQEPNQFDSTVAPLTVPRGTWTVFWDLISESAPAVFSSFDLPENPLPSGNVTVSGSQPVNPLDATQWTAVIENHVTDFNGFNYTFFLEPQGAAEPLSRHDPSIATSDPIGG